MNPNELLKERRFGHHANRTVHNSSHAEDDATREKNADASSPSPAPSSSRSTTGITRLLPGILNAGDWLNQVTALLHVRETVLQSPDPYGLPPRKPRTHQASAHALAPVVVVPEPIDVPNPPAAAESWHTARRLPHGILSPPRADHGIMNSRRMSVIKWRARLRKRRACIT